MSKNYNINNPFFNEKKEITKSNLLLIINVFAIVLIVLIALIFNNREKFIKKQVQDINLGLIGNKITVGETVAYVVGENEILVPYDFYGSFEKCNKEAYEKELKGCKNARLPSFETDDLPEEVTKEIIAFYGETGGFWTHERAERLSIEAVGQQTQPLHYAGVMRNYFTVGHDGVATATYGYCLEAVGDKKNMGLLVAYDIIEEEFEFEDIEDTANTE